MGRLLSVLLSLAVVLPCGAPTMGTLDTPQVAISSKRSGKSDRLKRATRASSEDEDEERKDFGPVGWYTRLGLWDLGEKVFESSPEVLVEWINFAHDYFKSDNFYVPIAGILAKQFKTSKNLYDKLQAIKDPFLQRTVERIEEGLLVKLAESDYKVSDLFEWMKADFSYASLGADEAAEKLFHEPSLEKLVHYAEMEDESAAYQSVAAVLAHHFGSEKLQSMIEKAKQDTETSAMAELIETGLRELQENKMSMAVKSRGDWVHIVRPRYAKHTRVVTTLATLTTETSLKSSLPSAPLLNSKKQQVLADKAGKPFKNSELQPDPVMIAKPQPMVSRGAVNAPAKSLPPPTKPLSNSVLARFRRWLIALWEKLRAKLRRSD